MNFERASFIDLKEKTIKIQKWWKNIYLKHYYKCPVCYNNGLNLLSPYNCQHKFCERCVRDWRNHRGFNCPCCRASEIRGTTNNYPELINSIIEYLIHINREISPNSTFNYNNNNDWQHIYYYNNNNINNNINNSTINFNEGV